jgi:hypothetical protein
VEAAVICDCLAQGLKASLFREVRPMDGSSIDFL